MPSALLQASEVLPKAQEEEPEGHVNENFCDSNAPKEPLESPTPRAAYDKSKCDEHNGPEPLITSTPAVANPSEGRECAQIMI